MLALFIFSTLSIIGLCIYGLYMNWSNTDLMYNLLGFSVLSLCSALVYTLLKSPTKRKYIIYFMYLCACLLLGFSIWRVLVGGVENYWFIGACALQIVSILILHYTQPQSSIARQQYDTIAKCTRPVFQQSPTRSRTTQSFANGGIFITNNDKVLHIRELSGPVSFSVLFPPSRRYPPIILLGDQHQSYQGMCETRKGKTCNAYEGCFSLMSPDFYIALDHICPEHQKIDIFSEQSMFREIPGSHLTGPLLDARNISTNLKDELSSIRWHLADPRFPLFGSKHYFESILPAIKYQFNMSSNVYTSKNADNVRKILMSLVNPETRIVDIDNYVDTFVDVLQELGEGESIIVKEMRKQTFLFTFDELRAMFKTLLYESWNQLGDWYFDDADYEEYVDAVERYTTRSSTFTQRLNYSNWKFYALFVSAFAFLLDIYTILRMFKQYKPPHEQSALIVGYFGFNHTKRLQYILNTFYGYEAVVNQHFGNNGERCHIIEKPVEIVLGKSE